MARTSNLPTSPARTVGVVCLQTVVDGLQLRIDDSSTLDAEIATDLTITHK